MENFAESKNIKCFETSAKNDTNVNIIFEEMVNLFFNDSDSEIKCVYKTSLSLLSDSSEEEKKSCCFC